MLALLPKDVNGPSDRDCVSNHYERHADGEVIIRLGRIRFWKQPKHALYPPPKGGWTSWELHIGRLELRWHRKV